MDPPAAPAAPAASPGPLTPGKRRKWLLLVLILFLVAGASGAAAYYVASRPPEPPGSIRDLRADAAICVPKDCEDVTTSVHVEWSAPASGEIAGYRILRDGQELAKLGDRQRSYDEEGLALGETYTYQVQALGPEENGPTSGETEVQIPVPPLVNARLDGSYDVKLVVRSNRNLAAFLGIQQPAVGDSATAVWRFDADCPYTKGACDTKWYGERPALKWKGKTYSGTVSSGKGRCYGGGLVPTKDTISVTITKAAVQGNVWKVVEFKGTYSMQFTCDGRVAAASAMVTGKT
jgi:hypothetical protein